MPKVTIDGIKLDVPNGKTIIQAAVENGIDITHFCWHPELSVSGNCRMCLVEIGTPKKNRNGEVELDNLGNPVIAFMPKLQIACATPVSDGMHVKTKSPQTLAAQEAVMEFILINHPLDCPICDEAGQCKLQEYEFKHSNGESRFLEEKNHKPKRQSWGPNVMYDAERCISCSRCIRFAKEYAEQDILSFTQRGDRVTIQVAKDKELDNNYSMNVIDICPVGALTSKDFRFKSRVWDMSFNESICSQCSRGCNIKVGVRNNQVLRIEPDANMYVNKYWMCDVGRLSYENINENRITEPFNKDKTIKDWKSLLSAAANSLKKFKPNEIAFIASANASNEDLFLFHKLAKSIIKSSNIDYVEYTDSTFADDKLRTSEKSANINVMEILGFNHKSSINLSNLIDKINDKSIKAVYSLDSNIAENENLRNALKKLDLFIVHSSNNNQATEIADFVFAASTHFEACGTFTNINKRVQMFEPALVTTENQRYTGMKLSRLDQFGSDNDRWNQHGKRNCYPNWLIIKMLAKDLGANWQYKDSAAVFSDIVIENQAFKGMNYKKLKEYQGLTLFKGNTPDPKIRNYKSHYMKPE